MNYHEALHFIHGTNKFGSKPGLDGIKTLLDALDNPQNKLKFIHIAGTNGKGSSSILMHNILVESGYQVGLFVSPFLEKFTERIQINGSQIQEETLAHITGQIKRAIEDMLSKGFEHPTEFEIVTAIGFLYFLQKKVDFVVLEVGLGGRFDATNVISQSELSIITSIGLDHREQLGDTLVEVAGEKAGIIKPKGKVVVYPQSEEIEKAIQEKAQKMEAKTYLIKKEWIKVKKTSLEGQIFSYQNKVLSLQDLQMTLLGQHQIYNASTILKAVEVLIEKGYEIPEDAIRKAVQTTRWPGRFEIISQNPTIILDGAHNIQGVQAFSEAIKEYFPYKKIILVLGVLKDKDVNEMLKVLLPLAKEVLTITPNSPRAVTAEELLLKIKSIHPNIPCVSMKSVEEAALYVKHAHPQEVISFTGSLYMIGEIRKNSHSFLFQT